MAFTTMTAPALEGKTPREIKEVFEGVAAERREHGGETQLVDVFFDIGKEVGYALYKDLGDSREIKKVSSKIGAIGITKMLAADQAEDVMGRAQA
jgi:hypothetical protein